LSTAGGASPWRRAQRRVGGTRLPRVQGTRGGRNGWPRHPASLAHGRAVAAAAQQAGRQAGPRTLQQALVEGHPEVVPAGDQRRRHCSMLVEQARGWRWQGSTAPAGGTGSNRERVVRPAVDRHRGVPVGPAFRLFRLHAAGGVLARCTAGWRSSRGSRISRPGLLAPGGEIPEVLGMAEGLAMRSSAK